MPGLSIAASPATSTSRDIEETDDDSSTIGPGNLVPTSSLNTRIETMDNTQDLIKGFGFSFDRDLKASRVYMRTLSRNSNFSCSSSVVPSIGWSFLQSCSNDTCYGRLICSRHLEISLGFYD